ncbi:uncharacterized protein LOC133177311 [Saccostrea echinata]|uniref:uncharacterized protein LOC133177311 n=1 Tax=Saccostrea echinata TaxID=191078 RepID=UPI002A7EFF5B|nr:uncharacterized protein LOC133177311 [Saccostrea echinata]
MKLLVAIACVLAISGQALADWMHPHYSFRCRESEGIEIFGIHKDSTVIISNGTCKNTPLTQHEGIFNISYNCTDEVKGETPTAIEVEISVKDPIFDETTSATTVSANKTLSTTTQVFIGGHNNHKFKIRCLNIPNAGVNKTVAHVFEGGSHILPDNQKEVSSIEMHFKSIEDINSPDISEIYIGDEFFMFLKYTGVSHYEVIPKQCTAYAGTVVPGERGKNVSLWDESKTGCKVHEELLSSINKYQNKTDVIAAKIYGFRFKGSNYITIACEVGVFPKNSQKVSKI